MLAHCSSHCLPPPCFLVHAADDDAVPVVCHVFANGGHGFGLKGNGDSVGWPALLESWISSRIASAPKGGAPPE